jgi:hypothetical protein
MENYIKKYFNQLESNINKHLNNPEFSSEEKEKLGIRLELINELKHNISWQFKGIDSKQASRIQHLETMRKTDALPKFIRKQEIAISIYDQIRITIPYLDALNHGLSHPIINFINNLRDKLDLAGYSYHKEFPSNEEVENAFKSYFEVIKPANGNTFKECHEKIESLYNELMKLSETT